MFDELIKQAHQFQANIARLEASYQDSLCKLGSDDEQLQVATAREIVRLLERVERYEQGIRALNGKYESDEIPF